LTETSDHLCNSHDPTGHKRNYPSWLSYAPVNQRHVPVGDSTRCACGTLIDGATKFQACPQRLAQTPLAASSGQPD